MTEQGTPTTRPASQPKLQRQFVAGAWLLVLTILGCGFFAGLAGKKVGDEHTMFIIAFVLLGIVVLEIFALAFADMSARGPEERQAHH